MSKLEEIAKNEFKWLAKRSFDMATIRDLILESEADNEIKFYTVALYDKAIFRIFIGACVAFLVGFIMGFIAGISAGLS